MVSIHIDYKAEEEDFVDLIAKKLRYRISRKSPLHVILSDYSIETLYCHYFLDINRKRLTAYMLQFIDKKSGLKYFNKVLRENKLGDNFMIKLLQHGILVIKSKPIHNVITYKAYKEGW